MVGLLVSSWKLKNEIKMCIILSAVSLLGLIISAGGAVEKQVVNDLIDRSESIERT